MGDTPTPPSRFHCEAVNHQRSSLERRRGRARTGRPSAQGVNMDSLWVIAIVLALIWAVLLAVKIGSKLIHLLIVGALVLIAVRLVTG
jgi:hypothetical protein